MALIIAGEKSGVGKTTVTLAMLSWLVKNQNKVQSFKVGPDYIDPLFHSAITGIPCRNLDPILTSPQYVRSSFNYHSQNAQYSLIEGVMGLFDGVIWQNQNSYGSTAYIAKLLDLPVVLIIDCSKLSTSVGAIASGYLNFDSQVKIVGLILNKVGSEKHLQFLKTGLESVAIPIVGVIFREQKIELPSRHLGLIPVSEISNHNHIFQQLYDLAQVSFNWDLLLPYINNKKNKKINNYIFNISYPSEKIKIAVAYDLAFSFYYQDNLDILEQLGAEIIFFSPLEDQQLPPDIGGIYLGGGFPEIFAEQLANNYQLKQELITKISQKMPVYAECGGMMYLSESITDFQGKKWQMLGILANKTIMTKKLTLGYRQATVLKNNCFTHINTQLRGHEFHRSQNNYQGESSLLEIEDLYQGKITSYQGWQSEYIFASYLHLHFANYQAQVLNWLGNCRNYLRKSKQSRKENFRNDYNGIN